MVQGQILGQMLILMVMEEHKQQVVQVDTMVIHTLHLVQEDLATADQLAAEM